MLENQFLLFHNFSTFVNFMIICKQKQLVLNVAKSDAIALCTVRLFNFSITNLQCKHLIARWNFEILFLYVNIPSFYYMTTHDGIVNLLWRFGMMELIFFSTGPSGVTTTDVHHKSHVVCILQTEFKLHSSTPSSVINTSWKIYIRYLFLINYAICQTWDFRLNR